MPHALIVEDDIDAAQMMAALIATENFTVATAHTLGDVRRQIVLQQPDIVLLDVQLPDGNGLDLFDYPELVAQSEVVQISAMDACMRGYPVWIPVDSTAAESPERKQTALDYARRALGCRIVPSVATRAGRTSSRRSPRWGLG